MKKNVTIMDVARDCGLSKSTVAYALNNSENKVSLSKREIVQKSASKLGYRTNIMAQSLRSGKTNSIGLLWSLGGPHNSIGLVRNISICLMDKGYSCYVADSLSDLEIVKQCLADFSRRNVDGLIAQLSKELIEDKAISSLLHEISNVVIVTPEVLDCEFDNLTLDRTESIREIVDHFAASGRKKIKLLLGTADTAKERVFTEQLKFHNLACFDDSIICLKRIWNEKEQKLGEVFLNALQDKFDNEIPFDALIVSCDEAAIAIINYLKEKNHKIPDDIAVVGFNNNPMAYYFNPKLASVDRCNKDVSEIVIEMLLNRIKDLTLPLQDKLIKMKFIHRESAG